MNPIFLFLSTALCERDIVLTGTPSRIYSPLEGVSRHPNWLSRVDFPEPDLPMMVTNSPSCILNDTPLRAWTVSSPTMKSRLTFCSSITTFFSVIIHYVLCEMDDVYFFFPGGPGANGERSCVSGIPAGAKFISCIPVITVIPSLMPEIISVLMPSVIPICTA